MALHGYASLAKALLVGVDEESEFKLSWVGAFPVDGHPKPSFSGSGGRPADHGGIGAQNCGD